MNAPLVGDSRSLDALKNESQRDPRAAVQKAAVQFEALFMQMVLKSMRDATLKSDLMSGGASEEMATSMFDQQLAVTLAQGGTRLAQVLTRQLTQHLPGGAHEAPPAVHMDTRVLRYRQAAQLGAASEAATATTATAPAISGGERAFVQQHWASALKAQQATGVPAGFIVSQAALESGWGKGQIRHPDGAPSHNLFGIKAGQGWTGRTVDVVTTEYENGVAKKVTEKFRAYENYEEAFNDWARLMTRNPRYAAALQSGGEPGAFAQGLARSGYATDPNYGEKLMRVMSRVAVHGGHESAT